jgi:hypothetical protein
MATYVLGIGGTGSRVIRAITMLAAAGVDFGDEIRPIIMDVDLTNPNETENLVKQYCALRESINGDTEFFKNRITMCLSVATGSTIKDTSLSNLGNQTFSEYIGYQDKPGRLAMLDTDKRFIESLYSTTPAGAGAGAIELNLNLQVGFKGNPNLGGVVLQQLIDTHPVGHPQQGQYISPTLQELANIGDGDKIFIISSIFGGTGASGFPKLVELLRTSGLHRLEQAKIGAVSILPYFNIAPDTSSAIDSAQFNSKTKAAINYYQESGLIGNINNLYYLYDEPKNTPYTNIEGGERQKNDAHMIELLAVASLLHFQGNTNALGVPVANKQYIYQTATAVDTITNEGTTLCFKLQDFDDQIRQGLLKHLIKFSIASKVSLDYILQPNPNTDLTSQHYYPKFTNTNGPLKKMNDEELSRDKDSIRYFMHLFGEWLGELHNNKNSLSIVKINKPTGAANYKFEENINALLIGYNIPKTGLLGFRDKSITNGKMNDYLAALTTTVVGNNTTNLQHFIRIMASFSDKIIVEHFRRHDANFPI